MQGSVHPGLNKRRTSNIQHDELRANIRLAVEIQKSCVCYAQNPPPFLYSPNGQAKKHIHRVLLYEQLKTTATKG